MAWFWKKKESSGNDAAVAEQMVAAATSSNGSQRSEQDWAKLAKEQQKEEKRREKEMERVAKQAMKEMKDEVKKAQKARAKAEKEVKKQVKAVRKQQEQETKQQRKLEQKETQQQKKLEKKHAKAVKIQAKASKRALRDQMRRRKRAIRLRKKEEKRRRKQNKHADAQLREQDELERQRVQAQRETEALQTMHTAFSRMESVEEDAGAVAVREAPKFKESKCCESCNTKFKRLPNYRRHHCRNCGESFCGKCLSNVKRPIPWFQLDKPQKVCFTCDVQVFNGMGGVNKDGEQSVASADGQSVSSVAGVTSSQTQAESPLQHSVSQSSEHPEDDSPRASPSSSRRFISLRPRSRRDNTSSKSSKKNSLWTLPIRPLLKRKASADQLRNRSWDLDLLLEKEEMLSRQRKSQMVLVSGPPQFAQAV